MKAAFKISIFDCDLHTSQVVALWTDVFGYDFVRNDPHKSIERKLVADDNLFFVAETPEQGVVGTVMAGYDGHRGWIYSLSVKTSLQRQGIGSALMHHAEEALRELGCVKINLQILAGNEKVVRFYESLGYGVEPRISMGKEIAGIL